MNHPPTCPVCYVTIGGRFFRCNSTNNHYYCEKCFANLKECSMCRTRLQNRQSVSEMNERFTNYCFACEYKDIGCTAKHLNSERLNHEQACIYRNMICPAAGVNCKFSHPLNQPNLLLRHFVERHPSTRISEGFKESILITIVDTEPLPSWAVILKLDNCLFMTQIKQEANNLLNISIEKISLPSEQQYLMKVVVYGLELKNEFLMKVKSTRDHKQQTKIYVKDFILNGVINIYLEVSSDN